jgi:hypothetical protein
VSIATGELSSLIRDLVEALDGEGRTGMGDLLRLVGWRRQRLLAYS